MLKRKNREAHNIMYQCPLCNGLRTEIILCPNCKIKMLDGGTSESYLEPYSPYLPEKIQNQVDGVSATECVHLFYCPHCGYDHRYVTNLINGPELS